MEVYGRRKAAPSGTMQGIRAIAAAGLTVLLAVPATAEDRDILGNAERIAAGLQLQPKAARSGRSAATITTTLALVGGGLGLVLAGNPEFVPSRFAPGNMPRRVDLGMYLGDGTYPGHRYQVLHRREPHSEPATAVRPPHNAASSRRNSSWNSTTSASPTDMT